MKQTLLTFVFVLNLWHINAMSHVYHPRTKFEEPLDKSYSKPRQSDEGKIDQLFFLNKKSNNFITDISFWTSRGYFDINESINQVAYPNENIAKNVIIFVGDGMGISTLTASRIYKQQSRNNNFNNPESSYLTFEQFPHMGLSKVTYL